MLAGRARGSPAGSLMVDPADAVSEAVVAVEGPDRLSLPQHVRRVLLTGNPLGHLEGAVAARRSRAEVAGRRGAGSRQVASGSSRILHFDELTCGLVGDPLDRLSAEPAWARGTSETSPESRIVVGTFVAVLAQRFRVRTEAIHRGLEVAGTSALTGDGGVGMTPATSRRRGGLIMK